MAGETKGQIESMEKYLLWQDTMDILTDDGVPEEKAAAIAFRRVYEPRVQEKEEN